MSSKKCQICERGFRNRDLYPITLIRPSVMDVALKKYPHLSQEGFVCFPDLRNLAALHAEEVLRQERGALTALEEEIIESIQKHELLTENINEEYDESLTFGQRLADKFAHFGGSWTFISIFGIVLLGWMFINTAQFLEQAFDPYPYILLNLVLSSLAAIQAPIIMMSQNRQAEKDRLTQENDYQTNLKAELQIRQLNTRMDLFMKHDWQKMHELTRMQGEIMRTLEEMQAR